MGWRKPEDVSHVYELGNWGKERRTSVHASEDVVCLFGAGKHVFLNDLLPSLLLHFGLEEDQEIVIVFLFSEVLFEVRGIVHIFNDFFFDRNGSALVVGIVFVGSFDLGG